MAILSGRIIDRESGEQVEARVQVLSSGGSFLHPREVLLKIGPGLPFFYCDGSFGIYFHPGVWHTPALPLAPAAEFDDRQGRVHARVSCHFPEEFGAYLSVPLRAP